MSDTDSRLPARPSLEQLRKQAKERLRSLRLTDPTAKLAAAQRALAREYGYGSWPKLVAEVESRRSGRLERFRRLADDLLAGWHGDEAALERLVAHHGVSYSTGRMQRELRRRVTDARGGEGEPSLDDVRSMLAREHGQESWAELEASLAADGAPAVRGDAGAPPRYRIDPEGGWLEPVPPLTDHDWDVVFGVMRERGIGRIRMRGAMTDSALEKLSALDFVTAVELEGMQGLTDDELRHLSSMPQLEELGLGGRHSRITDRGLEVLLALPRLRRFSMAWAQNISDQGASLLRLCPALERVDLMGTPTGDGALTALRGMEKLHDLVTGREVTDEGLAHLHDYPVFRAGKEPEGGVGDLMRPAAAAHNLLIDGSFTDRGLAGLSGLDGVWGLHLFWHARGFSGAGLASLEGLANLAVLGCQGEMCDDAAMAAIGGLSGLRGLMAQGTIASDDGFVALSRSRSLEWLWGRQCPNLTGRGFAALADVPSLQGLGVSCKNVDDEALGSLRRFPALSQLMPMDVTDAGFRHVGACERLEDLICMYCNAVGDAGTEHVAKLPLRKYYAGDTRITDRSLEVLGGIDSLRTMELWRNPGVTDAGIAELARLPALEKLFVGATPGVTRAGLAVLGESVRVRHEP